MYALEKAGGSIIAGVIKQIQAKRANPPPPRDARLPPKPAGQTVGSFRKGLQSLPRAIAAKHADNIRSSCAALRIFGAVSIACYRSTVAHKLTAV